jgi:ABC-type polar amino acid transport system ATPase subunit
MDIGKIMENGKRNDFFNTPQIHRRADFIS